MPNTLYMVAEHFKTKDAVGVYRRFWIASGLLDNSPRTSSLRFPELRLRSYRRSSRAPLGRRM